MKPSVYVETSLASYLVAWPSESLITAAHQRLSHQWWQTRRAAFDLFVSELVLLEARAGDPDAAARRLAALAGTPFSSPLPLRRCSPSRFFVRAWFLRRLARTPPILQ
jgi:hypothetical protein